MKETDRIGNDIRTNKIKDPIKRLKEQYKLTHGKGKGKKKKKK